MKTRTLLPLILLLLLAFVGPAAAQGPVPLTSLRISLWPEYDDPRLLVIYNGVLPAAGQTVRLPIPDGATINAVAAASGSDLVNIPSETSTDANGVQVLSITPDSTMFHVEYYTPLLTNGDERAVHFEMPADFLAAQSVSIEALLPPDAGAIQSDPAMTPAAPVAGEPVTLQRAIEGAAAGAISQKISYTNATGALTVAEDARNAVTDTAATPVAAAPAASGASAQTNWLPIALAALAVLLVGGGGYGLWRSRQADDEPPTPAAAPKARSRRAGTQPAGPGGSDRFCRQCGTTFAADDRFCRKCGARRQ